MRFVAVIIVVGFLGCSRPAQREEPSARPAPQAAADAERDPAALRKALAAAVADLEQANSALLTGGGLGSNPAEKEKLRAASRDHAARVMGIFGKLAVLVNDNVVTEADTKGYPEVVAAERALSNAVDLGVEVPR